MTPENKKALLPCPFCGARDIFVREKPNNSDAECHQCGCVAGLTGWNARADLSAQAAADDEVLMPKKLTAENGSKYAMIGEFYERIEDADGNVTRVALSWKNIKAIYDKAVELHGRAATRAPDAGLVKALEEAFSIADTEIQKPGDVDMRYRALKRTWLTLKEAIATHKKVKAE